jgi:hypothetical protein
MMLKPLRPSPLRAAAEFFVFGGTMKHRERQRPSFWKTPLGIGAAVVAVAASVYLYLDHKARVSAVLPLLLLAACPLMHVFMHRGHGHGQAAPARLANRERRRAALDAIRACVPAADHGRPGGPATAVLAVHAVARRRRTRRPPLRRAGVPPGSTPDAAAFGRRAARPGAASRPARLRQRLPVRKRDRCCSAGQVTSVPHGAQ